jgi:hypothetical protein
MKSQLWNSQRDKLDLASKNEQLVHELQSIVNESGDCNPFLSRLRSVLTETHYMATKKSEPMQDQELERALNGSNDQMVPERDLNVSNEEYFN